MTVSPVTDVTDAEIFLPSSFVQLRCGMSGALVFLTLFSSGSSSSPTSLSAFLIVFSKSSELGEPLKMTDPDVSKTRAYGIPLTFAGPLTPLVMVNSTLALSVIFLI